MARMLRTTVYLTPELKDRLEQFAASRGRSEADVIRSALAAYTADQVRPRPRLPLFSLGTVAPVEDWDEALKGFGED